MAGILAFVIAFLGSKRNVVLVVTVAGILWQMWQHIQRGEPIPESLFLALAGAFSAWNVGESIRPSMPKAIEPKEPKQ